MKDENAGWARVKLLPAVAVLLAAVLLLGGCDSGERADSTRPRADALPAAQHRSESDAAAAPRPVTSYEVAELIAGLGIPERAINTASDQIFVLPSDVLSHGNQTITFGGGARMLAQALGLAVGVEQESSNSEGCTVHIRPVEDVVVVGSAYLDCEAGLDRARMIAAAIAAAAANGNIPQATTPASDAAASPAAAVRAFIADPPPGVDLADDQGVERDAYEIDGEGRSYSDPEWAWVCVRGAHLLPPGENAPRGYYPALFFSVRDEPAGWEVRAVWGHNYMWPDARAVPDGTWSGQESDCSGREP